MVTDSPTKDTKFVIVQGVKERNRFYSDYQRSGQDPTKLHDGTKAYCVLGYCESVKDAQQFLGY